eukprot:PhM_4_TR16220/c0_g1_i1/m.46210
MSDEEVIVFSSVGRLYQRTENDRYKICNDPSGVPFACTLYICKQAYDDEDEADEMNDGYYFDIVITGAARNEPEELLRATINSYIAVVTDDGGTAQLACEDFDVRFKFSSVAAKNEFREYVNIAMFAAETDASVEEMLDKLQKNSKSSAEDDDAAYLTAMMSNVHIGALPEVEEYLEDVGTTTTRALEKGEKCETFADSVLYSHALVVKTSDKGGASAIGAYKYSENGFGGGGGGAVDSSDDEDGAAEFALTDLKGGALVGRQARLVDGETHVLLRDANHSSTVFDVDLSVGTVVSEYKATQNDLVWNVQSISAPQISGDNVFSCCAANTIFAMDRRLPGDKCLVLPSNKGLHEFSHRLSARQHFTCHATAETGAVVVGDRLGQLRLFSGAPGTKQMNGRSVHPKTAKTLLPGLGKPITHVDITASGSYVVATCDQYLIVACTTFTDDDGTQTTGFERRMGMKKKQPIRLELSPQQVRLLGGRGNVKFTKGSFEMGASGGDGESAHWIVAACGSFISRWSFDDVRKSIESGASTDVKAAVVKESEAVKYATLSSGGSDTITPLKYITDNSIGMRSYTTSDTPIKRIMKK